MTADAEQIAWHWADPSGLAALDGAWRFDRRIDDLASMSGTAVFAADEPGRLTYREAGQLRLADGQSFQAERRYLFRARADGFAVFFAEAPPRLFHDVVLTERQRIWSGEATHLCGADEYRSRYEFRPDGTFSIHHAVRGPRKSYRMETSYRRFGAVEAT